MQKKIHHKLFLRSTMCGHTLILVYLTLMVKMEKNTFIIYYLCIQHTKLNFNISISLIGFIICIFLTKKHSYIENW
jgi:hypothetical protein